MKYFLLLTVSLSLFANGDIYKKLSKELNTDQLKVVRQEAINLGPKAIPELVKVINSKKHPVKSKWNSIFLIGQLMGEKSIPYIEKLSTHKNWMVRLACLKTLTRLRAKSNDVYSALLKDKAMIVRYQALETISNLKLKSLSKNVWAMLYDDRNYSATEGKRKRSELIKKVITVVGDLKFKKAKKPLLKMARSQSYDDIFGAIDYSLAKITDKESKGNSIEAKRLYWKIQSI